MIFSQLSIFFQKIEQTASRVEMTKILAELFQQLSPDEIEKTSYLLQGRVGPLYDKTEFSMAEKMVARAVASALQLDKTLFDNEYKKIGDYGQVTEDIKKQYASFEEREMSIVEVYNELLRMAKISGAGSQELKLGVLSSLIRQLDALSCRYIVRIPTATLRLGFSDMTILDAYSWMITGDKSLRPALQEAYQVRPDLGLIGKLLKEKGIEEVQKIQPEVFTPIIMMRAERLSSGEEILKQIGTCSVEPKFDGFRLQVHFKRITNDKLQITNEDSPNIKKGEVRLYTRGLEDSSEMYPDIIEGVLSEITADEVIFEGEALGFDPHTGNFLPFQETVQRKRKHGIEEKAKEIPLKLFSFELLYCDGVNYIHKPLTERRAKLEQIVTHKSDVFNNTILIANAQLIDDPKKLELMFDDEISKGLEGIMAKKLDGTYQPGARGWNWIKFKRSYSSKIDDTIDCLVMGYDFGKGKRVGFGIGAFLVGIYDAKEDKYLTVAKIGTGLTDDEWRELKEKGESLRVDEMPVQYDVDKMMNVDVWITPKIVVEIKADELTRSPTHTAGRVMKASKTGSAFDVDVPGFALRFPRLQRFRDDKSPQDVTTIDEVSSMFDKQGK